MQAVNKIILSVDEEAAFQTESGLFKAADHGSAFDHITQDGIVVAAPYESGLDVGDKVYFKHMCKDDKVGKKDEDVSKFNWIVPGIENVTYTIEKTPKDDDAVGWSDWVLCTEEEGELYAYGDQIIAQATKQRMNPLDFKERDEPNIIKVIDSETYEEGDILLKKKDGDYPLEIHGEKLEFIREKFIVGTENDNEFFDPMPGISFVMPHDEDNTYIKKKGIWLPKSGTVVVGSGLLLATTHDDLYGDEEVIFEKNSFDRIFVNGREFYAVDNDKILCTVENGNQA